MNTAKMKTLVAILPLASAMPVIGATYIEDFSAFSTSVSSFQTGGDQQQVISTSTVGSLDMTIDTSLVPGGTLGNYGGGMRTTIAPSSLSVGLLTSSDPADYTVVFDAAAIDFAPVNVDIFLNFRDPSNVNVFSQISINQNSPVLAAVVTALRAGNASVPVSINLSEFSSVPADVSGLAGADRFQFQINSRSPEADYAAGTSNVLVIDNVGIVQVPEPTSTGLLALSALCLIGRRRRA